MTQAVIMLAGAALVLFIIVMSWWFSAEQRARRAMRTAPRRRIEDVIEGELTRVIGSVETGGHLQGPLSGRACVYWHVIVQEYRSSGKSGRWVTIVDEQEGVDFVLRDETGKAFVKTDGAHPLLEKDQKLASGFMNDASPELEAFLSARGLTSQGWVFNKKLRYHEGVLEPRERVCVVGIGRWERDPDEGAAAGAGYRDARLPKRLVLTRPERGRLLLSDEPAMVESGR